MMTVGRIKTMVKNHQDVQDMADKMHGYLRLALMQGNHVEVDILCDPNPPYGVTINVVQIELE